MNLEKGLKEAGRLLSGSRRICVLTGAGASVASGVPTFRGKHGAWQEQDIARYADPQTYVEHPREVIEAFETLRLYLNRLRPNPAHRALLDLRRTHDVDLFTQNVDGFHARAGDDATELHGSIHRLRCCRPECGFRLTPATDAPANTCVCPSCGNWLRHDIVWFGEEIHGSDTFDEALLRADAIMFVGTSGMVTDTMGIAMEARSRKIPVIEINVAFLTIATPWTTVSIRGRAEAVLPRLVA